jgi:hypothetical protein
VGFGLFFGFRGLQWDKIRLQIADYQGGLVAHKVAALFWRDIMEKTDTKDRDAGKRKLDDAIEDIES